MADEITSSAILISMLMQLREENRELANELTTAQLMLRSLQSGTAGKLPDNANAEEKTSSDPRMAASLR